MSGPAAAQLGLHPDPIGTLEELRREGIGPAQVGSCAPPSKGVRGCAWYAKCIFRLTKNGGFRDQGPRNIGYFHRTHEGHKHQNVMVCYTFQQVLYERMRAGQRDIEDGLNGEKIVVFAQEGQTYRPKLKVNLNEGKPGMPPLWGKDEKPRVVPKFPRPGEAPGSEYEAFLQQQEKEWLRADENLREGPPLTASDLESEPDEPVLPDVIERALAAEHSGPAPVAAPVARKEK